jgi:uncharacterized cupin superfamily protein
MSALREVPAGAVTDAAALPLAHEPVSPEQIVAGSPTTGYSALFDADGPGEIGVWEMTEGAMRDTEVDEVFVVIAGRATVEFVAPRHPLVELRPGSVMRLSAGTQTIWTVHEPLRKVFIAR